MAEEEKKEGTEAPKSGGSMKLIIIINAVVLLLLILGGAAFFLMSGDKKDAESLEEDAHAEEAAETDTSKAPIYIAMTPAFVVNLENQEEISFLQVEMELMTYDVAVDDGLKKHGSRVRGELLMLLSSKQYHEINNIEGKRKLSQDAIAVIQKVLDETGAKGKVEALYFTSFVMQ